MQLFILRHAEAEPHASSDFARNLTPTGRAQLTQVANRHLQELGSISQVWVSPYVRTQQTLEHIRALMPAGVAIQTTEDLTPDSPVQLLIPLLEKSKGDKVLLAISYKGTPKKLQILLADSGFVILHTYLTPNEDYALVLCKPAKI